METATTVTLITLTAGLFLHIIVGMIGVERLVQWLKRRLDWSGRKVQLLAALVSIIVTALTMLASQALDIELLLKDPMYWIVALLAVLKASQVEHAYRKAKKKPQHE